MVRFRYMIVNTLQKDDKIYKYNNNNNNNNKWLSLGYVTYTVTTE